MSLECECENVVDCSTLKWILDAQVHFFEHTFLLMHQSINYRFREDGNCYTCDKWLRKKFIHDTWIFFFNGKHKLWIYEPVWGVTCVSVSVSVRSDMPPEIYVTHEFSLSFCKNLMIFLKVCTLEEHSQDPLSHFHILLASATFHQILSSCLV